MRTRRPAVLRRGLFRIVPLVRAGRQRDVLAPAAPTRATRPLHITALTVTALLAVASLLAADAVASSGRMSFCAPARAHALGIGIVAGRSSFAAGVGDGRMKSPLGTTTRLGTLASGADRGSLAPMVRPMVGQPPLGPRGLAGSAGLQAGCDGPCEVGEFLSVSCASATTCTAVGTALGRATLAESWNGTSWRIEPTPPPTGSAYSTLDGVSCPRRQRVWPSVTTPTTVLTLCRSPSSGMARVGQFGHHLIPPTQTQTSQPSSTTFSARRPAPAWLSALTAAAAVDICRLSNSGTGLTGQSRPRRCPPGRAAATSSACPAPPPPPAPPWATIRARTAIRTNGRRSPSPGMGRVGRSRARPIRLGRLEARSARCGANPRRPAPPSAPTAAAPAET